MLKLMKFISGMFTSPLSLQNSALWASETMLGICSLNPILRILSKSVIFLPSPSNISYIWNFGSLAGLSLVIQLISGIFISFHYSCDINLAFESVSHIVRDVSGGWFMRNLHANGATMFFVCLYMHIARGIYFQSFYMLLPWSIGVTILLFVQGTAFLGYVLPWGQMSFWGATVITNLVSSIPWVGTDIVYWLWGGFSVDNPTLTRFFSLHFLLPLIILGLVCIHLLYLHEKGSSNPLGSGFNIDKISFHPYFSLKDILGFLFLFLILMFIVFWFPFIFGDPENFIPANPLSTPTHIQPEWYFLFAYAILRAIPNKLGGVVALLFSILILFFMPLFPGSIISFWGSFSKLLFWTFIVTFFLLTYVGAKPVEEPYIMLGQILSFYYFTFFFISFLKE